LSRRKAAGFAAAATLLGLASVEGAARLASAALGAPGGPRGGLDPCLAPSPRLGWRLHPGFSGFCESAPRRFDARGLPDFDAAQLADRTRPKIAFLGDSNTFGFRVPGEATFVEALDARLPDADAINLGVSGYSSHQGLAMLDDALASVRPAVVVASFGFNDRRYVLDESEADSAERFRAIDARLRAAGRRAALERLHLARWLRVGLRAAGAAGSPRARAFRVDAARPRVDAARYGANLAGIVEGARRRGVAVILLALADNPEQVRGLREGLALLEAGRLEAAVDALRAAQDASPAFADLARLQRARALRRLGRTSEAERALESREPMPGALDGQRPIRLDDEYRDVMRRVAAEQGVPFVDAGPTLRQRAAVYFDECHFDAEGHRAVAALLLAPVTDELEGRRSAAPSERERA
jgi:lysophospholipase L1-like esterase